MEINPWLAYLETSSRAWLRVLVTPERLIGEWNLISTVHERDYTMSVDKRLQVIAGAVGEGLKPA